uniref:Uncharacterized protein n=1 Tax=Rhizophora mucronata TaxID=61149 RepID=A0A2P2KI73_RHIMU
MIFGFSISIKIYVCVMNLRFLSFQPFFLLLMLWSSKIIMFSLLVVKAIFTGEKIKDLQPLTTSSILILGQGNVLSFIVY